jgi:hypothetical protein
MLRDLVSVSGLLLGIGEANDILDNWTPFEKNGPNVVQTRLRIQDIMAAWGQLRRRQGE